VENLLGLFEPLINEKFMVNIYIFCKAKGGALRHPAFFIGGGSPKVGQCVKL